MDTGFILLKHFTCHGQARLHFTQFTQFLSPGDWSKLIFNTFPFDTKHMRNFPTFPQLNSQKWTRDHRLTTQFLGCFLPVKVIGVGEHLTDYQSWPTWGIYRKRKIHSSPQKLSLVLPRAAVLLALHISPVCTLSCKMSCKCTCFNRQRQCCHLTFLWLFSTQKGSMC